MNFKKSALALGATLGAVMFSGCSQPTTSSQVTPSYITVPIAPRTWHIDTYGVCFSQTISRTYQGAYSYSQSNFICTPEILKDVPASEIKNLKSGVKPITSWAPAP